MRFSYLFSISCLMFFLSAVRVVAQPTPSPTDTQKSEASKAIQNLQLTREQIDKIGVLVNGLAKPANPLSRDLEKADQKLNELLASPSVPISEIREHYRRIEVLRQSISRLDFEYRIGVREILRPEQRPKLDAYMRSQLK